MARVTGPLFSQTAAGNMAKGALQFRADRWGSHVYKPQAPAKQNQLPPSDAQVLQRMRFAMVRDAWTGLGINGQDYYNLLAAAGGLMNGWNLYLSLCLGKSKYSEETLLTKEGAPILDSNNQYIFVD
ncbi:MAG: hypothetical protein RLZZ419_262 [Pseudomonadota bacterium]|jgi:hypothetical protein